MSHPHVLFVEGDDDAHAVRNLLYQHDISAAFVEKAGAGHEIAIKQVEGVDDFPSSIQNELKVSPDLSALGVVADADQSVSQEWESIWRALHSYNGKGTVPGLPEDGWTGAVPTFEHDEIPVGAWLMPDNGSRGALEEFAMHLVPEEDVLWDFSQEVLENLPDRRFDDTDEGKARLHTWLAWQETPREPIGRAISQGVLSPQANLAVRFVGWVRRLFPSLDEEEA